MGLRFGGVISLCLLSTLLSFSAVPAHANGLDLNAYKGKVVYLDFWASWCNPCRMSFPWMNELQRLYGSRGFVVIGVNVDHDRELADEFLQANGAQFKIIYDPDGVIASQYNFKDMPTSYLIGRDGKVHYVHAGFYQNREMSYVADISKLLNEKAP
ncbi:MAG: TlpA family protein disulfide reductase [Alphaproteobacteria bacterium]|nr:TlpA family protein disulfide reductase [Alphaproteobacteria bacterium]MDE2492728.1 TlpA family protein disulfide reductase [Alphaproteobacteria bacterium]